VSDPKETVVLSGRIANTGFFVFIGNDIDIPMSEVKATIAAELRKHKGQRVEVIIREVNNQ
jgi:hypothetical protein